MALSDALSHPRTVALRTSREYSRLLFYRQDGVALIVVLTAMTLMLALGTALMMVTITETQIADNHRRAIETLYAADSAIDLALSELRSATAWKDVLTGASPSTLTDGPVGPRTLRDSSVIDPTADTPRELNATPWRLYAYGPLAELLRISPDEVPHYVAVWVRGDPAAVEEVLTLRATAYGAMGSRRSVEVTVKRVPANEALETPTIERVSWRER